MSSLHDSRLTRFALVCALALAAPAFSGVLPVSPGATDRLLEVTSACPAYSWSAAEGAVAYELAVLDVTAAESPVLVYRHRVEGAALSWTPSREACLAPGRAYAWLVRADVAGSGLGEWSAPRRFRVPGAPSIEEVDAALALLERWRVAQPGVLGSASGSPAISATGQSTPAGGDRATAETEAPLAAGVAAIRGEIPDVTGNAYGVFGITHSAAGAGVVARNEAVGPDLVLDGAAQGEPDTALTQSGLDRPSASGATFNFQNSGAGALTLQVDGVAVSKEGHAHAGEAITSGTVADARIAGTLARDSEVMTIVLASDGAGSGLEADTLDGASSEQFAANPHHHFGAQWASSGADYGLSISNSSPTGTAIEAVNGWGTAVFALGGGDTTPAVHGENSDYLGIGLKGLSDNSSGGFGVWGETTGAGSGVYGEANSSGGTAGHFVNWAGRSIYAWGQGGGRNLATLRVHNQDGSSGLAAYLTNASPVATIHAANAGGGEVLYLQNGGTDGAGTGGNDFIRAVNGPENDSQFRVLTDGEVRSDSGFTTPAADFAEMLPAEPGLEPGDVLAIGRDGCLVRSSAAFAPNVAGVYSTAPGFVGGHPVEGVLPADRVPLAVVGIVPVKVSAENGAIAAGDLLVASGTPGHAMGAGVIAPNGTVLGKALEPHAAGLGRIRMLVVLQ